MFPLIKVIIYGLPASTDICMLSVQSSAENTVSGIDFIREYKSSNPCDPQKNSLRYILWIPTILKWNVHTLEKHAILQNFALNLSGFMVEAGFKGNGSKCIQLSKHCINKINLK